MYHSTNNQTTTTTILFTIAKRGARGPYNVKERRTKINEDVVIREADDNAPQGYFTTDKEYYIPNEWKELYFYLKFGQAPKQWKEKFENNHLLELGTGAVEDAAMIEPYKGPI